MDLGACTLKDTGNMLDLSELYHDRRLHQHHRRISKGGQYQIALPDHLSGELLRQKAGIDIQHVPYKGGGAAVNDLLGGHIGLAFLSLSSAVPQLSTGKIRIIAVAEKSRYAGLPDVPTIAETVPGVEMSSWLGLFAPAATPQPIVARLHDEIVRILKTDAAGVS